MLKAVRDGDNVVCIFYGHPGVCAFPSHRALTIARQEGYMAKMLPGISAEDCMFADIGFDPLRYGCMTSEASELLLRNRPLDPSVYNIIWQVGTIGVSTTQFEASVLIYTLCSV